VKAKKGLGGGERVCTGVIQECTVHTHTLSLDTGISHPRFSELIVFILKTRILVYSDLDTGYVDLDTATA